MSFPDIKLYTLCFSWMNIRVKSSIGHNQVEIFAPLSYMLADGHWHRISTHTRSTAICVATLQTVSVHQHENGEIQQNPWPQSLKDWIHKSYVLHLDNGFMSFSLYLISSNKTCHCAVAHNIHILQSTVFQDVMPCGPVDMFCHFRGACCFHFHGSHLSWWRRQHVPLKLHYLSTRLYVVNSHKKWKQNLNLTYFLLKYITISKSIKTIIFYSNFKI